MPVGVWCLSGIREGARKRERITEKTKRGRKEGRERYSASAAAPNFLPAELLTKTRRRRHREGRNHRGDGRLLQVGDRLTADAMCHLYIGIDSSIFFLASPLATVPIPSTKVCLSVGRHGGQKEREARKRARRKPACDNHLPLSLSLSLSHSPLALLSSRFIISPSRAHHRHFRRQLGRRNA